MMDSMKPGNTYHLLICGVTTRKTQPLGLASAFKRAGCTNVSDLRRNENQLEMEVDFPRFRGMDVYGVMMESGVKLGESVHEELTSLLNATLMNPDTNQNLVRCFIALYEGAEQAEADLLGVEAAYNQH